MSNSLHDIQLDQVKETLLPNLSALSLPSYSQLIENFRERIISCTWYNMDNIGPNAQIPDYWELIRPSFEAQMGPGASLIMPGSAAWLSTSDNVIHLPAATDESFIDHFKSLGVLRRFACLPYHGLSALQKEFKLPVMGCDKFADEVTHRDVDVAAFERLNRKADLDVFSAFAAPYEVFDISALDDAVYDKFSGGCLFIKKDNTEVVAQGVIKVTNRNEFRSAVATLNSEIAQYQGMAKHVILQSGIEGESKSFQYFQGTEGNAKIISISRQFVDENGVYQGSLNPPLEGVLGENEALTIADMSMRVHQEYPDLRGIIMNDYIQKNDGSMFTLDPGLRPTGNTGTSIARLFAAEKTGDDYVASMTKALPAMGRNCSFAEYFDGRSETLSLTHYQSEGWALLPWGYNPVQGLPVMALVWNYDLDKNIVFQEVDKKFAT